MKRLILAGLILGGAAFASIALAAILQAFQGGTGYGTSTTSTVGQFIQVASTSPYLTYQFASSTAGVQSTTPFTNTQVVIASSSKVATLDAPTDTIQRFLSSTGNGSISGAVSWQVIPAAGYITYYMTASSSDVSSNLQLQAAPQSTLASTTVASLGAGTSSIQYFITNPGAPNITAIPAGVFQVSFTARQPVVGGQNVQLYGVVNETNASGTKIATIETTNLTTVLTNTSTTYNVYADMPNPYLVASSTSRIQLQIVASVSGGGTAPTAKVYYGGSADDSRLVFPSEAVSARNYVPYTGATKSVNLGVYGLTAQNLAANGTSTTNGISNTGNITSTNITDTSVTNALVLSGTGGLFGNYGGASACAAGNAVTTISATGATTCSAFLTAAVTSINGNTNAAHIIAAGTGISVSDTQAGATATTTITNTGITSINGATGTYSIVAGTNITISTTTTSTVINSTASGGSSGPATSTFSFVIEYPNSNENDAIWIAPASTTVDACNAVNMTTGDTVTMGIGASSTRAAATSTLMQIATSTVTATTTPASLTILNSHVTSSWPVIFWTSGTASSTQFSITCEVSM